MSRLLPLALLLLCLPGLAEEPDPKARYLEISKALKEVRRSPDWPSIKRRRELIRELSLVDHPGVAPLLYDVFRKDREQLCRIPAMVGLGKRAPFRVLKSIVNQAVRDRNDVYLLNLPEALAGSSDPEIGPWLVENLLPVTGREMLKATIVESLGLLRCSEAYAPLLEILSEERGGTRTLRESLIALARIGEALAHDPIVPFLSHEDPVLRAGAVLALGETGHPAAPESIRPLAGDPDPRVQEAVAEVLEKGKAMESVEALISMLGSGRLRVIDRARRALKAITGEKLGVDADAWKRWLLDREAGDREAGDREARPDEEICSIATYHGLRIFSDRILFVVDISGSMESGEPRRIDLAKRELERTLGQLSPRTLFNVVAFGGSPLWWREGSVPATPENLADARDFLGRLTAGGGTNIFDTLEQALLGNPEIDTIFFLGDGSPSKGSVVEQEEILARIRWHNRIRGVRIHTIAFLRARAGAFGARAPATDRTRDEEEAARFMARLAEQSGGSFLLLDR